MSELSAPPSPLEVRTPPLPPVADDAAAAAAPALPPPALPAPPPPAPPPPAPPLAVPTAGTVGNIQVVCKYGCFSFADDMLTFTDGFRPLRRRQPPRRPALRAWSPRPAARLHL